MQQKKPTEDGSWWICFFFESLVSDQIIVLELGEVFACSLHGIWRTQFSLQTFPKRTEVIFVETIFYAIFLIYILLEKCVIVKQLTALTKLLPNNVWL